MRELVIRKAALADYKQVNAVYKTGDNFHFRHGSRFFRQNKGFVRPKSWFKKLICSKRGTIFIAEYSGKVVGVVDAYIQQTPKIPVLVPQRFVYIRDLAVLPHYKHKGIGRVLMRQAETWGKKGGAAFMELSVWEFNGDAQTFYKKLGYRTVIRRLRKKIPK